MKITIEECEPETAEAILKALATVVPFGYFRYYVDGSCEVRDRNPGAGVRAPEWLRENRVRFASHDIDLARDPFIEDQIRLLREAADRRVVSAGAGQ